MNKRGFVILGLVAVFTLVTGDEPEKGYNFQGGTCPSNMHYMECGSECPKTCTDVTSPHQSPTICALRCVSGCFCDEGYVYANMTSKHCIPYRDCKPTCQANSEYVECGTACPITCENYRDPPIVCTRQCVRGCACKHGYILESATSKNCIPPSDCRMTCQDQAHYTECDTACPLTCDNYNDPRVCTLQCVAGCVCNEGYVLESASSNQCVQQSSCKTPCNPFAHYEQCGTACPKTCADVTNPVPRPCTLQCASGCFCDKGYVLENADSDMCVKENLCKACDANSHFTTCASACPLNCQNYRDPPKKCILLCLLGCKCREGYVFKSGNSGPCVPVSECPRTPERY